MKNKEIGYKKIYNCILIVGVLGLLVSGYAMCNHVLGMVMDFQKHIIGILQEHDEKYVQTYVHAMFEVPSHASIEKGSETLELYGYTDAGIRFIAHNMGMQECIYVVVAVFILLVGIIFLSFYRLMRIQRQELDLLRQENFKLKEQQMQEEYVSNQNRRIQSFIENIAHQMKTPISRVYTSLDIVESELTDGTNKQHVEECYQHLDSMNNLMKRLMDIGRLEAGKVIFQKELLDLKSLLEELRESFDTEKARIRIDCKSGTHFYGDEKWLREALLNILANALEADNSAGGVEISCVQEADYIKLSVRDHGQGLSEKDIPNIFDRFYLPENVKENHTGIGLNLAKLIIEGHQGSVYVYNHFEGGAVFQIILPTYESLKVRG